MLVARPRVAAIGLSHPQIESIESLCGTLRTADSVDNYAKWYDWTETDVLIGASLDGRIVADNVHVLAIRPVAWSWSPPPSTNGTLLDDIQSIIRPALRLDGGNTERELHVPPECPPVYSLLASGLASQLRRNLKPPPVFKPLAMRESVPLLQTTSAYPVAIRYTYQHRSGQENDDSGGFIFVAIPLVNNVSEWFHAFLTDINTCDKSSVPYPPPRLSRPQDWYTPEEKHLAYRMKDTKARIAKLEADRSQLECELQSATQNADTEARRVLWADGNDLVEGIKEILTRFDFNVEDMDAALGPKDAKREDLRLTLDNSPGWEAIVEVKGYRKGTKASDARQIRQHRDDYMREKGRVPDLTLWIANPFRQRDPSHRQPPDREVVTAAENVGALYVSVPDLYKLWILVAEGSVEPSDAARRLVRGLKDSSDSGGELGFRRL